MNKEQKSFANSWFNIKQYSRLKDLNSEEWSNQISTRKYFWNVIFNGYLSNGLKESCIGVSDEGLEEIKSIEGSETIEILENELGMQRAKALNSFETRFTMFYYTFVNFMKNPIVNDSGVGLLFNSDNIEFPFDTITVKSISASEIWDAVNNSYMSDVWDHCQALSDSKHIPKLVKGVESVFKPYDLIRYRRNYFNNKEIQADRWYKTVPWITDNYTNDGCYDVEMLGFSEPIVKVDISATEEQILKDFQCWLRGFKNFIGYKTNYEGDAHWKLISKFIQHRCLQYIDVKLIAGFRGEDITYSEIAEIIFKDQISAKSTIDFPEKIKKSTKVYAEIMMNSDIEKALYNQAIDEFTSKTT